jgi:hypothetical protein
MRREAIDPRLDCRAACLAAGAEQEAAALYTAKGNLTALGGLSR